MKVGDYVRTKNGNIRKILEFIDKDYIDEPDMLVDELLIDIVDSAVEQTIYMEQELYEEDIVKSSPNIIDIIEVGDYVNGFKIDDITEKDKDHPERIAWHLTSYGDDDTPFRNDEIKSIITKEQFSSMEYEVE